tara:strand:- start:1038 stop:1271 length:234 start_codon:yes stop_codon:yes gene_type:complete
MKSKDKAKELVDDFWMTNPIHNTDIGERNYVNAIKCALICVDNIIDSLNADCGNWVQLDKAKQYWLEVKGKIIEIIK